MTALKRYKERKATMRTESWSQIARRICDKQIEYIEDGYADIKDTISFISRMEENPIIIQRALKRFGRRVRKENIHNVSNGYSREEGIFRF